MSKIGNPRVGDYKMIMNFLLIFLIIFAGCAKDAEEDNIIIIKQGDIFGTVTNKETGKPIENAYVNIGGKTVITKADGRYIIEDIPFSDDIGVMVTASDYIEYSRIVSINQDMLALDIVLVPAKSPSADVLAVLDALSSEIESLDPDKIPLIQSHFSEKYTTDEGEAMAFGIFAGVIPPSFDKIPETMMNIVNKYTWLEFKFANPVVKLIDDSASVQMRFTINAETKPPEPKKWEIVIDGKLDLKKHDDDWKIEYWELVPPFLKFEENPL